MSYDLIDSDILAWVNRNSLKLFTHYEGNAISEFRAVYVSSEDGECCQIWIDPPTIDTISVHARSVETRRNEEMQNDWHVQKKDLGSTLEDALKFVRAWFGRPS